MKSKQEQALKFAKFSNDVLVQRKKRSLMLLGIGVLAVFTSLVAFLFYRNYGKQRKINSLMNKAHEEELKTMQLTSQQELLKNRLRISRDLHDEIGATLSGIAMYSHVVKDSLAFGDAEKAIDSANVINTSSREAIAKLNDIIWLIKPDNVSMQTVLDRLGSYALEMGKAKSMKVIIDGQKEAMDMSTSLDYRKGIYLIAKEAINNAVKYSNASTLSLLMGKEDNAHFVQIEDDGKGFNLNEVKRGHGLYNMVDCANDIGAEIDINSAPNAGTRIRIISKIT